MLNLLYNTVSFPGLGIEPFKVNNIAVSGDTLGFLKNIFGESWNGIAWYGVIIMFGIVLSAVYAIWRAHKEGITTDDILDVILVAVIVSVIGARLYYVIFYGGFDSFYDLVAVWNGGLAIYGAVIGGILSLLLMGKIKKINPLLLLDIGASSIILGQAIGRWGNFMNIEAFGYETDLPWRMGIGYNGVITEYVHPTFLYESLWNIIGFFIIWYIYNHKKYNGQIFLTYLAWYGLGRLFIEGLRTDSLWLIDGVIRVSQLVGAVCFVVCAAIIFFIKIKRRKRVSKEQTNGENN
ncbi:MAG: prolipoprotein diacylglyceryl transferase [Clostridia bacterium]|nr:prolipoprotein diacylglyceryl transferase [Clostridia bacterium]